MLKFEIFIHKLRSCNIIQLRFDSLYRDLYNAHVQLYDISNIPEIVNYFNDLNHVMGNLNKLIRMNDTNFSTELNGYMNNISSINLLGDDDNLEIVTNFFSQLLDF